MNETLAEAVAPLLSVALTRTMFWPFANVFAGIVIWGWLPIVAPLYIHSQLTIVPSGSFAVALKSMLPQFWVKFAPATGVVIVTVGAVFEGWTMTRRSSLSLHVPSEAVNLITSLPEKPGLVAKIEIILLMPIMVCT